MRLIKTSLFVLSCIAPAFAGSIIGNGKGLWLGVGSYGNLGVVNGTNGITLSPLQNSDHVGLYSERIGGDSVTTGCICEGWGVASDGKYQAGADESRGPNLGTVTKFVSTASSATSVVRGQSVEVTQQFSPSAKTEYLFDATVTVRNYTDAAIQHVLYRRLVDWDTSATATVAGKEYVSIGGWPATNLYRSSNDGFQYPNPLLPVQGLGYMASYGPGGCSISANFTDCGARDQGILFDFDFGALQSGQAKTFHLYYGSAPSFEQAVSSLQSVGAEVYSLARASDDLSGSGFAPDGTRRNTLMLAFSGVGGTTLGAPLLDDTATPEPGSAAAIGLGLGSLLYLRRNCRRG